MPLGLSGSGLITGFDPTASGFGKVLQVVRATDTTNRSTTSNSYVDITGMSVTVTPQKTTSTILLIFSFSLSTTSTATEFDQVFYRITDSSNNVISGGDYEHRIDLSRTSWTGVRQIVAIAYAIPATTSAVTYKMRARTWSSNVTFTSVNASNPAQMFAIEVAA